jgi:hypothetical protein
VKSRRGWRERLIGRRDLHSNNFERLVCEYIEYLTCDFGSVLEQLRRNFGRLRSSGCLAKFLSWKISPSEYAGAFAGVMAG